MVNGVGVGAVLNGNKVVVGGGEVCDACVVAALSGGTEEIAKFWYGKLEDFFFFFKWLIEEATPT